ncbi:hypothetical protein [Domibacillus sp.]|uniref:hypothetical protein n=1 Tax=Domibacillus sp. TaxID=1969783 RepID=UPI002811B1FC|nr:hypothetical protein [Domibacillus sp.]
MNFDTKHLIRWGIPGWVYLITIIFYVFTDNPNYISDLKGKEGLSLIGLGAILAGLGVPVGYLIHQVSMFFGFIIWTPNKNKFFKEEYELDRIIFDSENKGGKIRERYRHLLSRVHELRALKTSHALSIMTVASLAVFYSDVVNIPCIIILIVNIVMFIIVHFNQKHFDKNLDFFKRQIKE